MSSSTRKPHILDLPNEILIEIFKHLPPPDRRMASEVGHCWYSILNHHSFLKNKYVMIIESRGRERGDIVNYVHTFLKSQIYFYNYEFYLSNMSKVTSEFWAHLGGNIRSLTISLSAESKLGYLDVINILKSCKRLEELNFTCKFALPDCNSVMKFEKMHYELPYLKNLNLSHCTISDAVIYTIVKNSPAIETLDVLECSSYKRTDEANQYYYVKNPNTSQTTVEDPNDSQTAVEAEPLSLTNFTISYILNFIKSRCTKIKHLRLSGVDDSTLKLMTNSEGLSLKSLGLKSHCNLTEEVFSEFVKKQCFLRKLVFSCRGNLSDSFLLAVCRHLTHLENLNGLYYMHATDSGIREIHRLKKLRTLILPISASITNDGVMEAIGKEKNYLLKKLHISSSQLNEDSAISLSESLPNLHILDMSYSSKAITDESLRAIIKNLTKLEVLKLKSCKSIYTLGAYEENVCTHNAEDNHRSVTEPIGLFSLKRLRELDLGGCSNITSESLEYSLRSPRLVALDLSGCTLITHETITQIVKNCPNIENLCVYCCENITSESTKVIMTGLNKLKFLDIVAHQITAMRIRSRMIHKIATWL